MFPHVSDDNRLIIAGLLLALFFGLCWWWNRSKEVARGNRWGRRAAESTALAAA